MKKAQPIKYKVKNVFPFGDVLVPDIKAQHKSHNSKPTITNLESSDKQGGRGLTHPENKGYSPCQPLSDKLRSFLEEYIDNENDNDNYLLEKDIREAIRRLQEFVNGRNAEDWNGESKICCCDICQIAREIKNIFGTLADEVKS